MAKPWEDTIVMVLRDTQWIGDDIDGVERPPMPGLFIKLDGMTEKAMGDVIFEQDEKLYLFEVKASEGGMSSEWNKRDPKTGELKQKQAFLTLSKLMEALNVDPAADGRVDALWSSLKCHHFIYWSDEPYDLNDTFGNIMVRPYIAGCLDKGCSMPPLGVQIQISERVAENLLLSPSVPFSCIRNRTGYVGMAGTHQNPDDEMVTPLGEDIDRFVDYLDFLVRNADRGSKGLQAVIYADKGSFTRSVKSTDELRQQIKSYRARTNAPKSHPRQMTRDRQERAVPKLLPSPQRVTPFPTFSPPKSPTLVPTSSRTPRPR